MKQIKLKGKYGEGKYTLVSDEDYNFVKKLSLYVNEGYVKTYYRGRHRKVHQLLVGKNYDHINRDKLDNRRENLRKATQNQQNANKGFRKNESGYIGVYPDKSTKGSHKAMISVNGKMTHIGNFPTSHLAALARDLWAKDLFGDFATLNFPIVSPKTWTRKKSSGELVQGLRHPLRHTPSS